MASLGRIDILDLFQPRSARHLETQGIRESTDYADYTDFSVSMKAVPGIVMDDFRREAPIRYGKVCAEINQ